MLNPTAFKRKISVRFYLRLTAKNQNGLCPVRLTARWHGEEMQRDTGEVVLPERPGKGGFIEVLWDGARVTRSHDQHVHINARLAKLEDDITTTFFRQYDLAPFEKVGKAALMGAVYPATAAPVPVAAPVVSRTFRQVLEEWKGENRNLAKDSLRKYDQLATMMETWRADLRPEQVTQKVAKEYQQHLLDLQKSDATIKVHFGGIRKCLEQLGLPAEMVWLQYSAKNAPQLDLEIEEVRRLIQ